MAFSNYIFQSIVTAFILTGYGFALYGKLQRCRVYYAQVAIEKVRAVMEGGKVVVNR